MTQPQLVDLSGVCPQLLAQQRAWLDQQPATPEREGLQSLLDYLADHVIYRDPSPLPTLPRATASFHVTEPGQVDELRWFCSADCLRASGLVGRPQRQSGWDTLAPANAACSRCGARLPETYTPAGRLALWAPTYWGRCRHGHEDAEFSLPYARLAAIEEAGLRILLGGDRVEDACDDLLIERHPHGWLVILHREQDPCACLYIHDDGRTFFQPERLVTTAAEVLDPTADVPGFTQENP